MESEPLHDADAHSRVHPHEVVTEIAGDRISRVRGQLPGLRRVVVARVAKALTTERFRRRMRAQLDHLSSRANPHWPDAIMAHEEIVEQAIQEIAAGGRAALAAVGRLVADPDGWESAVAAALDDDSLLALAVEAARAPRPPLPFPPGRDDDEWARANPTNDGEDKQIGASRIVRYSAEPADRAPSIPYGRTNWRVIGIVEHRYPRSDRYPHKPDGEVVRRAALEARPDRDESGLEAPPLGYGDARLWKYGCTTPFEALADRAQPLVGFIGGPGAGGARGWPLLGFAAPLLVPQPPVITTLRLVPRSDWLELVLYDEEGCGLVYRAWRSLYETSEYELPRPSICGSALLLRPDLLDRLLSNAGDRLAWREHLIENVTVASRESSGQR